ncbi:MAG: signal peptidase I [Actinomycetota bacterium]|nr:signal peptidase I [Actinomycetota bacterium]
MKTEHQPSDSKSGNAKSEPQEGQVKRRSFWRELPVLLVLAFVVALLIKTYLLQAFFIPSASMEPTLTEGDRVLVEKISYRLGEPDPGDVIVFERDLPGFTGTEETEDDSVFEDIADAFRGLLGFPTGPKQDFIKRVVGVEGDLVEGRDGRVFVNGKPVEETYLPEELETTPFEPIRVGKDQLFVMGDNRGNSDDSRSFGPIPEEAVVGHAFVLVWPLSDLGGL